MTVDVPVTVTVSDDDELFVDETKLDDDVTCVLAEPCVKEVVFDLGSGEVSEAIEVELGNVLFVAV